MKKVFTIFFATLMLVLALSPLSVFASSSYYTNVSGAKVHVPVMARTIPSGASARCRDGEYSFSKHRRGTCSGHGGVSSWL